MKKTKKKEQKIPEENKIAKFYKNKMIEVKHFDREVVIISPSLLKNKLYKFKDSIEYLCKIKYSSAIVLMSATVLVTADNYKEFMGISGEVWHSVFVLIFFISLIKFLHSIILLAIKSYKKKTITIDSLIEELTKNNYSDLE